MMRITRGCSIDVCERIEITDGTWRRRMVQAPLSRRLVHVPQGSRDLTQDPCGYWTASAVPSRASTKSRHLAGLMD